jgi:hypothetical protein
MITAKKEDKDLIYIVEAFEIAKNEAVKVTVDGTNTGDMKGDEVIQLYIRDDHSTVTRPVK